MTWIFEDITITTWGYGDHGVQRWRARKGGDDVVEFYAPRDSDPLDLCTLARVGFGERLTDALLDRLDIDSAQVPRLPSEGSPQPGVPTMNLLDP